MNKDFVTEIDHLLPQTQCGLCGYGACRPYAQAVAFQNEAINRCPPGGVNTLIALSELLQRDATPFIKEMQEKAKLPTRAFIREEECIGCTKCIQACPVDAIIGTAKQMHTVIANECTGCELCVAPCPVDCIEMIAIPAIAVEAQQQKSNLARQRYQFRQQRLEQQNDTDKKQQLAKKSLHKNNQDCKEARNINTITERHHVIAARKQAIQAAIARVQAKKKIIDRPRRTRKCEPRLNEK
jgi:Na+-translocating ferredoxin:NAD+ oxidoreductase subunit B